MNESFVNSYDNLNISNKRNELSNELLTIGEYLKVIENFLGYNNEKLLMKKYNINSDKYKSEEDILTIYFENIYNIERELKFILELLTFRKN